MIDIGHIMCTDSRSCVICKKKTGNFIGFYQKNDDIKIEICVCNEHQGIVTSELFSVEMEQKIKETRKLAKIIRRLWIKQRNNGV